MYQLNETEAPSRSSEERTMPTQELDHRQQGHANASPEVGKSSSKDRGPVNPRVLVLALATFAIGTGTFIVTGLLGGVAEDLSVSVGTAGHLVTVFAVAVAALSPLVVAATGRVERRRLLVVALFLFALANAAAAVAPTFSVLLAARVGAACFAAICTPVAAATAAQLVPAGHKGRALSVTIGGVSAAWVVGVPSGAVIADHLGWRMSFVLVAVLAVLATVGVGTLLPEVRNTAPAAGLSSRFAVAARPDVLNTLLVTVMGMAAAFAVLTYVRPLLEDLTGFGGEGIGALLLVFGLASIAGSVLGGHAADRRGYRANVVTTLAVLSFSLLSFPLLSMLGTGTAFVTLGTGAALATWAVAGFALVPLQQHRLIGVAPEEQNMVLSLNSSAIYAGQGLGAGLGSLVLGNASPPALGYAGALFAAVALMVLVFGTRARGEATARRTAEPPAEAGPSSEASRAARSRFWSHTARPSTRASAERKETGEQAAVRPRSDCEVLVRPVTAGDREALGAMLNRLSARTIYERFHVPYPRVPAWALAGMIEVDHHDSESLVAVANNEIVGHAMYVRGSRADEAEFAVVVDDGWQSRGVGGLLLAGLAAKARMRGIGLFTGSVLGENRRALAALAAVFPGMRHGVRDGVYRLRAPLHTQPHEVGGKQVA